MAKTAHHQRFDAAVVVAMACALGCVADVDFATRFQTCETRWCQTAYLKSDVPQINDSFGETFAMTDTFLVVGKPGSSSGGRAFEVDEMDTRGTGVSGAVEVYDRTEDGFTNRRIFKAANVIARQRFGTTLDVDGDTIVVGNRLEPRIGAGGTLLTVAGAVYVVERGADWTMTELQADPPLHGGFFGASVAIDEGTIAVHEIIGCADRIPGCAEAGVVHLFERDADGGWTRLEPIVVDPEHRIAHLAIDGDLLVVGLPKYARCPAGLEADDGSDQCPGVGAAHVFERRDAGWEQTATLQSVTATNGGFGATSAVDGDRIVIGAPLEQAAYVFLRGPDGFDRVARLEPPESVLSFGASVALSESRILVGAPKDQRMGTGIAPSRTSVGAPVGVVTSGAVFVFDEGPEGWKRVLEIKGAHDREATEFGSALVVHNDEIFVGAPGDRSCASGVDGDSEDLRCQRAGSITRFRAPEFEP